MLNAHESLHGNGNIQVKKKSTAIRKTRKQHKTDFNFKIDRKCSKYDFKFLLHELSSNFDLAQTEMSNCKKLSSSIDTRIAFISMIESLTKLEVFLNTCCKNAQGFKSALKYGIKNNSKPPQKRSSKTSTNQQRKKKSSQEGNNSNVKKELIFAEGSMEHFEFKLHRGNIQEGVVIICKMCNFSTGNIEDFRFHICIYHFNIEWNSFCSICNSVIILEDSETNITRCKLEFDHLITHMNKFIMKNPKIETIVSPEIYQYELDLCEISNNKIKTEIN
ncbi:CLUMA_CG012230, isoform A [Clunio marinus]|uniref:CLUMA_CG012230, isoform A n=1 Tax=Clunio marinus TaxID=568069 RepID=A0A1J1IEY7_9DIPT|nr:CLUMA_CG012230, isoform A [Clunio marinus]